MVSELLEQLEAIVRALRRLQEAEARDRDPLERREEALEVKERATKLWQELGDTLGELTRCATDAADESATDRSRRLARGALLKAGSPLIDYDRNNLASFFKSIAHAVVDSQRDLDKLSLDYVRGLDSRLQPSSFAMPTVKAELKVGLREVTERGLNLVVFSDKQKKEEYSESTVAFELAAVPPPPGQVVTFPSLIVQGSGFLLVGADREEVLAAAERIAEREGKSLGLIFQREVRDLALVLRSPAPEAGDEPPRYLVIWPGKRENHVFWDELVIVALVERAGRLELDGPFEPASEGDEPGRGFLALSTAKKVEDLGLDEAARLAIALGDVLDHILRIIAGWLAGLEGERPLLAPRPPD